MRQILMAVTLVGVPVGVMAQGSDLDQAAERARQAWASHNPAALVSNSPRLLIQLPGADPAVALGPAQAAAPRTSTTCPGQPPQCPSPQRPPRKPWSMALTWQVVE